LHIKTKMLGKSEINLYLNEKKTFHISEINIRAFKTKAYNLILFSLW